MHEGRRLAKGPGFCSWWRLQLSGPRRCRALLACARHRPRPCCGLTGRLWNMCSGYSSDSAERILHTLVVQCDKNEHWATHAVAETSDHEARRNFPTHSGTRYRYIRPRYTTRSRFGELSPISPRLHCRVADTPGTYARQSWRPGGAPKLGSGMLASASLPKSRRSTRALTGRRFWRVVAAAARAVSFAPLMKAHRPDKQGARGVSAGMGGGWWAQQACGSSSS